MARARVGIAVGVRQNRLTLLSLLSSLAPALPAQTSWASCLRALVARGERGYSTGATCAGICVVGSRRKRLLKPDCMTSCPRVKTNRLGLSALSCVPRLHHGLGIQFLARGDVVVQLLVRHLAEPVAPDFEFPFREWHGDLGALQYFQRGLQ